VTDQGGVSKIIAEPRQRPVWNNLLDLLKVYGGDAEAFWKNVSMKVFLETHPQLGGDVSVDSMVFAMLFEIWKTDSKSGQHLLA